MLSNLIGKRSRSISESRERIILLAFYASVIICSFFVIFRAIEQRYDMLFAAIISLMFTLGFVYLAKKGHSQKVFIFSNIVYLGVAFTEGYINNMPPQTIIYFSLIPVLIAFLLDSNFIRILFFSVNIIAFIVLHLILKTESISDVFTYVIITCFLYVIILFFIKMLESQERQLFKALEERQKAIDALEEKHKETVLFNNMMNHDIKAPLRTIKGFSSMLNRTKPTEEQVEYIDFISNAANNLEKLIANILILSKINTVEMNYESVNINELLNEIFLSLSYDIQDKKVEFKVENLPIIQGNQEILRTVFQNIISNAVKYQPKIETHIPQISVTYKQDESYDLIYIQDNGIGINPKNVDKIFQSFIRFHSSAEYEGTGLGMAISKKIMEKHNGDIRYVENGVEGACFELRFPKVVD